MKTFSKIIYWLVNIIFYPVIIAMIATVILYACGIKPYVTLSGSMEPNIHTGSVCFVNTKAEYEEIQKGDIVAFETPNGDKVTHRVISVSEEGLETQGDANDVSDGISTTKSNFFGKTMFSVPYVGYAVVALQQPRNVAAVMVGVVLILTASIVCNILQKDDEEEKEETAAKGTSEEQ